MSVGCSGVPLARKPGPGDAARRLVLHAPEGDREWLGDLPAGLRVDAALTPSTTLVHLFVRQRAVLEAELAGLREAMPPSAAIRVSWPKQASKVPTDITEAVIRAVALPMGFVDIKVCAVRAVWSGLKLVIRKALRAD